MKQSVVPIIFIYYLYVIHPGAADRGTAGTEGTLLRRLLSLATRPSPLAASHSPKDLASAALTIVQQLAAHVAGIITYNKSIGSIVMAK